MASFPVPCRDAKYHPSTNERFFIDSKGTFAIAFAIVAPVLVILMGMGLDFWKSYSDKTRMDSAADAAAIASVNAAKAFYAANSGIMSGTTLSNAAIVAGKAQGAKAFAANTGTTQLISTVTPQIVMSYSSLTFSSTVSWSGAVVANFGPMVGIQDIGIGGSAAAASTLPKYEDFYVVVDVSASMGIPADASNQSLLMAVNPDNPWATANGYSGGCQFACHFAGYGGFAYTQAFDIPLKLNSVGASVQALLTTAAADKVIANQFRVGIYPFINDAIQAAPLSATFTTANTVAANLANYIDQGTANQGMGSGGTHFETIWKDMQTFLQTPGTGTSSTSPLPFIILVTDGVDNAQTYAPWSGSQPQLPSAAFCTSAKNAGYTVAVLLIPYVPIVNPQPGWSNNEDVVVNNLLNSNTVTPAMQSCASSGFFFSASSTAQIQTAMQAIFAQAIQLTRLTQ